MELVIVWTLVWTFLFAYACPAINAHAWWVIVQCKLIRQLHDAVMIL